MTNWYLNKANIIKTMNNQNSTINSSILFHYYSEMN